MDDQKESMILCCTREDMHPQEWPTLQIERAASRFGEAGRQGVFAPGGRIRCLEVELLVFVDVLLGLPIACCVGGTEGRMSLKQDLKGTAQGSHVDS
jgi:hypothetical protein